MFVLLDSPTWMLALYYLFGTPWGLLTILASLITGAVCGFRMWALSTSQGTLIGIGASIIFIFGIGYVSEWVPFLLSLSWLGGGGFQAIMMVLSALVTSGVCYLLNRRAGPRPEIS